MNVANLREYLQRLLNNVRAIDVRDIPRRISLIAEVAKTPQSNIQATLLLLALGVMLFLIIVVIALLVFLFLRKGRTAKLEYVFKDRDGRVLRRLSVDDVGEREVLARRVGAKAIKEEPEKILFKFFRTCATLAIIMAALFILMAGSNMTTQSRSVCTSCHSVAKHGADISKGAHAKVNCTQCHESGNVFQRGVGAFGRAYHIVSMMVGPGNASKSYGTVQSSACIRCHAGIPTQRALPTSVPASKYLNMSHKEPIAAGMSCTQCHTLNPATADANADPMMSTCLKCHDGVKASADCKTCHRTDPADHTTASPSANYADTLVP